MSATTLTLANGRGIDLLDPQRTDIHFLSLAEALAKEPRYNGHTRGLVYSVGEHTNRGVDAILRETGDHTLAAYWSLHDAAEALLKDDPTPKKRAIAEIAKREFGVLGDAILRSFDRLTEIQDAAIHAAAGLPWPAPAPIAAKVKHWDLRLFVTEWRDLMPAVSHPNWDPYRGIDPLRDRIFPARDWRDVKNMLFANWKSLLPSMLELRR